MTRIKKITKEYIIEYFRNYYISNKDIPKSSNKTYPFHKSTVINIFGSWNCALEYAKIPKRVNLPQNVKCKQCDIYFLKLVSEIKKSKNNNFCSNNCAAKYNNQHRKTGNRVSKLEKYLQENLTGYIFDYNNRKICNGLELDIFMPTLNLAFEINGIFHYKPVHGQLKFDKIVEKDKLKMNRCIDKKIKLIVIKDDSPRFSIKYGDHILNTIYYNIHKLKFKNCLMDILVKI